MIVIGQMRRQQRDPREREISGRQSLCNRRVASCRPGCLDPVIGGVFRQVKHLRAVGEEGRTASRQIQSPRIEFGEQRNKVRCRLLLLGRDSRDFRDERGIGQRRSACHQAFHVSLYHRLFAKHFGDDDGLGAGHLEPRAKRCLARRAFAPVAGKRGPGAV